MKKVILFISTLVLFINSVRAEEYSNWVDWLDPSIQYEEVQTETRYRFYKEEIEGEYLISDTLNKYKYNDIDDYIYSEFSNWQETCDGKFANIENKILYPYKKLVVDTNYVQIGDLTKDISFDDIKIYANEEEVSYEIIECDDCAKSYNHIASNEKLILKLDNTYPSMALSFYIKANSNYPSLVYRIKTFYDEKFEKIGIAYVGNSNLNTFIPNEKWLYLAMESDIMYSEVPVLEDTNTVTYPSKNMCRYQEKMTYYYNINKVYYDDNYYTNIDGYIKDINDYKVYYRYLINDNKNEFKDNSNYVNNNDFTNEDNSITENTNEDILNDEEQNIDSIETIISETANKSDTEKKEVPIVNTMSINKQIPIIKYIILIVIILTLIFIFYQNKKYRKKMSLE